MIEVSVIIPVYNREKTIARALDSLEKQTFKDFELIVVDDGSTDLSSNIVETFCKKNKNWKLFKLNHKGVSSARKFGIEKSSGRYLTFVDSDDVAEKEFIEILHKNMSKADISMCNYYIVRKKIKYRDLEFHKKGIFDKNKILKGILSDGSVKSFLWNKMFKRELFEGIFFPDISCFEDKIMSIQLVSNAKTCYVTDEILYNYYKSDDSIAWSPTEEVLDCSIECLNFFYSFLNSQNLMHSMKLYYNIWRIKILSILICVSFYKHLIIGKSLSGFFSFFCEKFRQIFQ